MSIATKKVVATVTDENPTGYMVINADAFDAKVHKEYTGPDYVPPADDASPEQQAAEARFNDAVAKAVADELAKREAAAKAAEEAAAKAAAK